MLTRIRNGQSAGKTVVSSPASRFRSKPRVLKREGYIRNYSSVDVRPGIRELKIELKYHDGEPVISEISAFHAPAVASITASVTFRASITGLASPSCRPARRP